MPAEESEDRPVAILRLVNSNHDLAENGHKRLRADYRELEGRIEAAGKAQDDHDKRLTKLENAPAPEISKLTFSWQTFLVVAGLLLGSQSAQWALSSGQRATNDATASDVRNILTQMSARKDLDLLKETLQNERAASVAKTLDALDKQLKLQQLDIKDLTNAVLDIKRSR